MKGLSRRKMFQTAAAAPMAAALGTDRGAFPSVGPRDGTYLSPNQMSKTTALNPIGKVEYLRERVNNLRANMNQPPSEEELIEQHYSTHHLIVENYNALRSLSPARRQRMIHDAGYEQSRKRIRELQSLELRTILKQLAGL